MNKKYKYLVIGLIILAIIAVATNYLSHHTVAVLQPRGTIAHQERDLMLTVFGLMLIVVIPVFILTFYIVWKYREGHSGKYKPDFDHSRLLEGIWWAIPTILIIVIGTIIWNSTHALNPYTPIKSTHQNMTVEVVALDWKWLFIYPKQRVASVNQLNIPVNTPVTFYLTADAPMNSFWIPQLGGQIYAMPGMTTQLNLMATSTGDFYGSSANISGSGFASMHFMTDSTSQQTFNNWVSQAQRSPKVLNQMAYNQLDRPSSNNRVSYYSEADPGLFSSIIDKYMMAPGEQMSSSAMSGMAGM